MNLKSASKRKRSSIPAEQKQEKSTPLILSYFKSHEKKTSPRKIADQKTSLLKHASSDDDVEIVLVEKKSKYFESPRSRHGSTDLLDNSVHVTDDTAIAEGRKPKLRKLSLRKRSTQTVECSKSAVQNNDDICIITRTEGVSSQSIEAVDVNDDNAKIMTRSQSCKVSNSSNKPLMKKKLSLGKQKVGKDVLTEVSKDALKLAENACSRQASVTPISKVNNPGKTQNYHKQLDKDSLTKTELDDDVIENVDRSSTKTLCVSRATCAKSQKRQNTSNLSSVRHKKRETDGLNEKLVFHNTPTSSQNSGNISSSDQELKNTPTSIQVLNDTAISNQDVSNTSTSNHVFNNHPTSSQADTKDELIKEEKMETEETKYRIPYYLENFQTILSAVLENEDNELLFDKKDLETISLFSSLSDLSQKLYVRLFSRKLAWLPLSKLKYSEIANDLTDVLQEIIDADLAVSEIELTDLEMTLKSLPLPDLKILSKSYHLNVSSKTQIVDVLLRKSKQSTIGTMFGMKSGAHDPAAIMLARAKKLLGRMFRLQEERRKVFVRVLMLFSVLHSSVEDDSANGGQSQLYQMLLVNMGKVVYPKFKVNRQTQLFLDRESFLRFATAMQFENDLSLCVEKADWAGAFEVFKAAKQEYDDLQKHSDLVRWDSNLPCFLCLCSAGFVLVRVLSQGIEILQRQKDYSGAISLIHQLLDQLVYCCDYRGYWWERLALNLDVHLKKPKQALGVIKKGLSDENVHIGHRLALYQRAEKICNTASLNVQHRLKDFHHAELVEIPTVTIDGRIMPHTVPGIKNQFITAGSHTDEITCCGVEQFVLDYYKCNGYTDGLHAEGSVISSLFCLFFWDILFMDIPDAFHSAFQTRPLDFHSELFYTQRCEAVEDKLSEITDSTEEDLHRMMSDVWTSHDGVLCAGMSWDRFSSLEHVQGLVSCIGGKTLAAILRRFVTNPRHTRSGFPDLTLWNTDRKIVKICEVKGPGDRLSHKQILWIDFLIKIGVDAEVCHVRAVGAKKLKPAASTT
ncbi:fanconi-associated nuclease 1-like [Gigantopelta aegis]|uniref:fanconi-associated nuclease 1-like n=1 Tax=Gigantopelta aegis TaxID=1735272 RepID=UPI001B887D60|nr:fanconi-associated nuclease 1-like [Gigantopelta aegis]